ncbi:MAG TPA: preprotein translocase subunit YajC, partial [Gemmatimonadaceae bacterium]|nr:preprotein translocase subunit YajC [Gemmatimonadaceae bacterium]
HTMNNPLVGTILMYGAIGAIFYFVLLRPQQKQKKEHDTMLRSLRRGDEIVTAGGVVGEVTYIAQQTKDGNPVISLDDRVTIKSGDTRLIVERGRIAKIMRKNSAGAEE